MKNLLMAIATMLWAIPAFSAKITLVVDSVNTGFHHEPYYVAYIADTKGKYVKTLQVFGYNINYARTMKGWYRNAYRKKEDIDALSGASLKKGDSFTGDFDIDPAYIDKGYQVVLETSSENKGNLRKEIVIKLDKNKPSQKVSGKDHTEFMSVTLK